MCFKDRERYLDSTRYNYIFDRGGNAVATILVNGRVVGVWDFEAPLVKIFMFNRSEADVLEEVKCKAKRMGVFISGKEVKIKECTSMIPLVQRTAGSQMSPLKGS
jgi:hypothetical protein